MSGYNTEAFPLRGEAEPFVEADDVVVARIAISPGKSSCKLQCVGCPQRMDQQEALRHTSKTRRGLHL